MDITEYKPRPLLGMSGADTEEQAGSGGPATKLCTHCNEWKPLGEFKRRTGRRSGATGRRGACRACRLREQQAEPGAAAAGAPEQRDARAAAAAGAPEQRDARAAAGEAAADVTLAALPPGEAAGSGKARRRRRRRKAATTAMASAATAAATLADAVGVLPPAAAEAGTAASAAAFGDAPGEGAPRKRRRRRRKRGSKAKAAWATSTAEPIRRIRRPPPTPPPRPDGPDASVLRPTRSGIIKMRGKTDKGRRWVQETDLATAINLVREHAAVVVNPHTIRRLYSSKAFRVYVLTRDRYTCYFCGEYGDTIDHLVPRAKGGHTTPINCVCACQLCNQSKADRSLDDFVTEDGDF